MGWLEYFRGIFGCAKAILNSCCSAIEVMNEAVSLTSTVGSSLIVTAVSGFIAASALTVVETTDLPKNFAALRRKSS